MTGLGRIYRPDPRDRAYLMALKLPEVAPTGQKLWAVPYLYDQGHTSECVGYSCSAAMTAMCAAQLAATVVFNADGLYRWANANDGIGGAHDGSTVRAGLQGLLTIGDQVIQTSDAADDPVGTFDKLNNFLWADTAKSNGDIDRLITWILTISPVVIGISWYNDMFHPDANGIIHPTGPNVGGHAICVRGVNAVDPNNTYFVLRNSWNGWGVTVNDDWSIGTVAGGDCVVQKKDMIALLTDQGEAGALVDNLKPIPVPIPAPTPTPAPAPPKPNPIPPKPPGPSVASRVEATLKKAYDEVVGILTGKADPE